MKACTVDGCTGGHWARGMCVSHYNRWARYGDPTRPLQQRGRHALGFQNARAIWAYISIPGNERASHAAISGAVGLTYSAVHYALLRLETLGYITIPPHSKRARIVHVRLGGPL